MKKIEFSAKTKDGIIVIPKKYQKMISKPVKVIIRIDNSKSGKSGKAKKKDNIDSFFDRFNIDLSGYKFNREEANER